MIGENKDNKSSGPATRKYVYKYELWLEYLRK